MNYSEYKKLKEAIDSDYQKKKDALEMIWQMSQQQSLVDVAISPNKAQIGGISDAIRRVIDGLAEDFSVNDIQQGLKDHNIKDIGRLSITNTLHRLCRRGEIHVVKKGQGRMASTYRKVAVEGTV